MSQSEAHPVHIFLRNVRCFVGPHSVPLAPLTILVGENSSGKTTFLSALNAIVSGGYPIRPVFSRAPYDLGGFSAILTRVRKRKARPTEFELGMTEGAKGTPNWSEMMASYSGARDRPILTRLQTWNSHGELSISSRDAQTFSCQIRLSGDAPEEISFEKKRREFENMDLYSLVMQEFYSAKLKAARDGPPALPPDVGNRLFNLALGSRFLRMPVHSVAPIRTKPRRTYDAFIDVFSPEGEHVPGLLAQTAGPDDARTIGINSYGRASGLYRSVKIKPLGDEPSAPFQVLAKMPGIDANLTDVGYGVSQVLPVVFEALGVPHNALLAMQQPEVHLHPKAQAELGSLLAQVSASRPTSTLVVETHSDYLVNRVRREVAAGTLKPEHVCLLFFERKMGATKVHRIELDAIGNVASSPKSYREFFVREELSLLTRAER